MGKMALYIIIGVILAFSFIGYSLNRSNVNSVRNVSGYFNYSSARNISHTAVNIALHKLENGDTTNFTGSAMGGTYNVTIDFLGVSRDTLDLTSRGQFVDTSYTMLLKLRRYPKPFPNVDAAVGLAVDSVNFSMQGSASIDGRNYDINGNLQSGSYDKPGVGVMAPNDSTTVAAYSSKITGSPKIDINPDMANPLDYVEEYIAQADYYYSAGTYGGNDTWGSVGNPVIIVCDAGASEVKFTGTINGWGILIVKGNLALAGTFRFTGLVLVYQTGEIDDQVSTDLGTPRVNGGIIMTGGAGSTFKMKGNGKFAYSWPALENAKKMAKLQAYTILRWYE